MVGAPVRRRTSDRGGERTRERSTLFFRPPTKPKPYIINAALDPPPSDDLSQFPKKCRRDPPFMERKDKLPRRVAPRSLPSQIATGGNLPSSSSSSNASTVSPTELVRQVKAVIKHRNPLGARAGRVLGPLTKPTKSSSAFAPPLKGNNAGKNVSRTLVPMGATQLTKEKPAELGMTPLIDSSLTPPSVTSTFPGDQEVNVNSNHSSQQNGDSEMLAHEKSSFGDFQLKSQVVQASEGLKDVQPPSTFTIQQTSQKDNGVPGNKINVNEKVLHQLDSLNLEMSTSGAPIYGDLEKGKEQSHNQQCIQPATQFTLMHSSCVTTNSLHLAPTFLCTGEPSAGQAVFPTKMAVSASHPESKRVVVSEGPSAKDNQGHNCEDIVKRKVADNADCLQPKAPSTISPSSKSVSKPPLAIKTEKATRKKKYNHNPFFSVNGKQYQKLEKIGSGGSSEVFKVISADCSTYALKKIRLKGRDYATTYGFCQEIGYLSKFKGKSNIIQLFDYEVTDKTLLQQATEESLTLKYGRITSDEYIYMLLEYGEIDLAHMLMQNCKDVNGSSWNIDEDFVRFYWKKMLEAVNTIHEERIVHSDLKPANFLLVKGSLKLIDFGIAKAIMCDTTNIRRDAQAGTLNYMSPEAFMCNEQDQSGSTIKCGRPSDIWSLGCILYQMVYGKTPFYDYKTFCAKLKVITDASHEINYEPVTNPLLIDLMKRCLVWDRNKRWRIPQLLQHPFFMHPVPRKVFSPGDDHPFKSVLQRAGLHLDEPELSRLCYELQCAVPMLEKD